MYKFYRVSFIGGRWTVFGWDGEDCEDVIVFQGSYEDCDSYIVDAQTICRW